jgi:hypothetical protein
MRSIHTWKKVEILKKKPTKLFKILLQEFKVKFKEIKLESRTTPTGPNQSTKFSVGIFQSKNFQNREPLTTKTR